MAGEKNGNVKVVERQVQNTLVRDLATVYELFEQSILYQERKGYPVWRNYDRNAILEDIITKNQYKICIGSTVAIVFSVCYDDKIIWRHYDQDNAVYLHRIVVNPVCKGLGLFGDIVEWARHHAIQKRLTFIRMDTWANNPTLINYYQSYGFASVENYTTPDSPDLPIHNRQLALTLLEYKVRV